MATFEETDFRQLESQDVRDYWQHEAHQFTPWLADEIRSEEASHLEDVLGLDLEVIETERNVGKYSVDVLAEVVDDGRQIIIENQLETSDHDHLGKCIAYAAGVDADIIVWISPQFNAEHQDAFEWLNRNSRSTVNLFAIRLEVWRIGDSQPAIRLNPVEEPSEWKTKAQRSGGELSDRRQLQEEFWTAFRDVIEESSTHLRTRKPRPRHYYSNPIGRTGFHIYFGFDDDPAEIHISLTIDDDEEAFWELKSQEDEIGQALGTEVRWDEPEETRTGNMRSHIWIARDGRLDNQDEWDEYFDWMLEQGDQFHEVFYDRIQQL
ncbi:DUF4268 domain-containing protein [Halorubrum sp. DTA98]|uniref:DUF4268 domain-containing protein n=1 Tax=Halorubrum sp. DTA98 TaxID=3402163 RepID=UPI003AAEFDBD